MSSSPVRHIKTSPEIIQSGVLMYVRFPLLLGNVEDLMRERGIDVCHEFAPLRGGLFGSYFPAKIRKRISKVVRRVT